MKSKEICTGYTGNESKGKTDMGNNCWFELQGAPLILTDTIHIHVHNMSLQRCFIHCSKTSSWNLFSWFKKILWGSNSLWPFSMSCCSFKHCDSFQLVFCKFVMYGVGLTNGQKIYESILPMLISIVLEKVTFLCFFSFEL